MGTSSCCKRDELDTQANMNIITKTHNNIHNDDDKAQNDFLNGIDPSKSTNLLQSMHAPLIEPAVNNDDYATSQKVRGNNKYWNDVSRDIEDVICDISDDKSERVFTLLNQIRTKPTDYIAEAKAHGVDDIVTKASKSGKIPSLLCQDESYYYELREVLMNGYTETPKNDVDILKDIKQIKQFDKYNINIYIQQVELDKHEDAVWMLLQTKNAYNNILIKKMDYCIVCAIPLKNTNDIKVYFVMMENKLRESAIL